MVFLLLAAGIRVGYVLATPHYKLTFDAADYQRLAISLSRGHGFGTSRAVLGGGGGPTASRAPLYPLFLAGLYWLGHPSVELARLAQALMGVVTVGLIGIVAERLWGKNVAMVVLGVAAVYPPLIFTGSVLFAEWLAVLLEVAAVAATLQYRREHRPVWALTTGVALAGSALTRANALIVVIPLALLLVWPSRTHPRKRRNAGAALMVGAFLATLTPWTIRNAVEFHAFVPVDTQTGFVAAGVYNDVSHHDPRFPASWRPIWLVPTLGPLIRDRTMNEVRMDDHLRSYAVSYAAHHPSFVPRVIWTSAAHMLELDQRFDRYDLVLGFGLGPLAASWEWWSFYLAAVVALVGAFTRRARDAPRLFWTIPVVAVGALLPLTGDVRFRVLADPFIVLLVALGLLGMRDGLHGLVPFYSRASSARNAAGEYTGR